MGLVEPLVGFLTRGYMESEAQRGADFRSRVTREKAAQGWNHVPTSTQISLLSSNPGDDPKHEQLTRQRVGKAQPRVRSRELMAPDGDCSTLRSFSDKSDSLVDTTAPSSL